MKRNQRNRQLTILKLGGSAITDKTRELTPDLVTIHRAADQIADYTGPLVLIHGGGSFAHPFAKRAALQKGYRNKSQLRSVTETELYLDQLSRIISVSLLLRNVNTIPVKPMSFLETDDGRIVKAFLNPFSDALKAGFVPLSHGDVVFDRKKKFNIVSGDKLATFLALKLKATKVLFGSDVDGIYTSDPKKHGAAELVRTVDKHNADGIRRKIAGAGGSDVTGGMRVKFSEAVKLAKNGCECYIFNLKREAVLGQLLAGEANKVDCTAFLTWK